MTQNELRDQLRNDTLAVVTTLREVNHPVPESTVYLAMGMDMDRYERIRGLLVASDILSVSFNRLTLTTKGEKLADDLTAILYEQEAKEVGYKR